jgi:3'(2'), 5'-bisphosphate nucleotidase
MDEIFALLRQAGAHQYGGEPVNQGEPVNLRDLWVDDRADMLRLPGIIACSANRQTLAVLCDLAKDWNPAWYHA